MSAVTTRRPRITAAEKTARAALDEARRAYDRFTLAVTSRYSDGVMTPERAAREEELAAAVTAAEAAVAAFRPARPAGSCEVCGLAHEVTAADRIGDRGEQVDAAEAMLTAHYRLAIVATSAAPFALHGGRAA